MSTSEALVNIVEDTLFEIVNTADPTKKLSFDLADSATGTSTVVKTSQTVNRTLTLPDRDGTLQQTDQRRQMVNCTNLDFRETEIGYKTLPGNTTLTINNPWQGKTILLEITGGGYNLIFPGTCKVLAGKYDSDAVNYIYIQCVDSTNPLDPIYLVTISQQIA